MSLQTRISALVTAISSVINDLRATKVDKISGKGLSTNDYTNVDKNKVNITGIIDQYTGYSTTLVGGDMTLTGGIGFDVSAGSGLVRDNTNTLIEISWPNLSGVVPQPGDNFIYIDYQSNLIYRTNKNDTDNIFIGYIVTDETNTTVLGFNTVKFVYENFLNHISEFTENVINVMIDEGIEFSLQPTPNTLNISVSSGVLWSVYNKISFPSRTTFRKFYKDSDGHYMEETGTTANQIDVQNWNDTSELGAAAIKSMTPGYYKKDAFFVSTRGNVFYEYGMAEYEHYDDALVAAPPTVNPISTNVAVIAHVIVQQGNPVPLAVVDVRPMFKRIWNGDLFEEFIQIASHHQLNGLEHDDHPQYHTDGRGDIRYYQKTELDSGQLDTRYYTEAEITTLLANKSNVGHTHVAADITDLSKTSVGLSNVQNVDQTNASNITSGTLANARLTANLTEIGNIVKVNGDIISVVGGQYSARTINQYKTDLSLNNVQNVDQTNAANITSGTLSNSRLTTNLSQLGGITFNANDFIQYNGSSLVNISPSNVKLALSLSKTDVGLSNVQNVDQTNASNITSGTLSNSRLSSNLSQLGGITFTTNDFIQYNGSSLVNISPSNVKLSLGLTKSDVGLSNVQNVDQTNASNITSGTLANARLSTNLSTIGGLSFSTNDIIYYNGSSLSTISPTSYKSLLSLSKTDVGLNNVINSLQVINAGNVVSFASGLDSAKSAAGTVGRFYKSVDQGITYYDNGSSWAAQLPSYTGDVTSTLGGTSLTLATVNSSVGTFNNVTVNAKGLVTAASNVSYLTGNQTITLSGDITGSGTTTITATLPNINSNVGTFNNVTVNAKGQVTSASNVSYLTTNQNITVSGDVTGSGTTSISLTLATVNSNVGTFGNSNTVPVITVNGKGLITSVSTATITPTSIGLGNVSNNLQVINAGGAISLASGVNTSRPTVGTANRFYYSTDQGIISFDNGSTWNNILPAYTGDVTSTLGGTALTLATVNSNVGTFGSTSVVPVITVNGKGLVTSVSTASLTSSSVGLGNVINSLQVINAGGAVSYATGTNASKPAAGTNGRLYTSTDQGITYYDNGSTWSAQLPAYTGDVTSTLGGTLLTLATVNSNVGTFNNVTVNAKGLVTAASNVDYLEDTGANGIVVRTSSTTTSARTITGTTDQITVTNSDGISGNPILSISDNPIIPGTGAMTLPIGTIAQRPAHSNGKIRFNNEALLEEISESNQWRPFGRVMQFITGTIPQTTGNTVLPYDATLPTSTEGFQIWTNTITPYYTNSTIVVIYSISCECSSATAHMTTTLLNGTTAISRNSVRQTTALTADNMTITHAFLAGTTSAITLSARVGPSAASTVYVNRGDTETMGGLVSSYIIMELY